MSDAEPDDVEKSVLPASTNSPRYRAALPLELQLRACLPAVRALCSALDLAPDARAALQALSAAGRQVSNLAARASAGSSTENVHLSDGGLADAPLIMRALVRALPEIGLRAHLVRGNAAELVAEARRSGVCVAMAVSSEINLLAIVRAQRGDGSARGRVGLGVVELDQNDAAPSDVEGQDGPTAEVRVEELGSVLAARSGAPMDGEFVWITASAAMPLAAIGPHGSARDDDGEDAHGADAAADADHHGHGPAPFARLRALARLERDDLWIVLVYAVAVGVLSLATPVAVQALVNTVAFGALVFPIVVLSLLLFAVLAIAGVLHALQMRVVETIQQRVFTRVSLDLAHRLPRVQTEALDRAYGPELVNRFFDVLTVQKSASIFLLDGLSLVLSACIGMLVLAFYHPLLLAFDVVLVLSVVTVLLGLGWHGPQTAIAESRAKYRVAAWLEDLARHGAMFRTPHGAELAAARADELARSYLGTRRAAFVVVFRQYVGVLGLQAVATAALLGLGGWLVIDRQLTLGQLVAAELIVATVVSNLSKLGRKIDAYYDLLAAVDKLGHLIDLPLERARGGSSLDAAHGPATLAVRDVRYAYDGGETVRVPTFSLLAGARVALAGGAGSGKSTIADVLFGLRAPQAGVVEIDGIDLRELSPHELRAHIALVRAVESPVLEGTLADNVTLGRPGLGHAEARTALDAVGLGPRLRALPRGIDTALAATGAPLGASDLRRLDIARAIVGSPRLLLVDGGLAGLDADARSHLLRALVAPGVPWSLVVLAPPDDPLVGACDRVFLLDERPGAQLSSGEPGVVGGVA